MSDEVKGQGSSAWTKACEEGRAGISKFNEEYARQTADNPPGLDEVITVVDHEAYPLHMIKQWLMGQEPELGNVTPLEALRSGRKAEVITCARRLGK